jgi:hypothetical protein
VYQPLNDIITERYPIPSFDGWRMDEAIPLSIRNDYAEAVRCTYVKACKGAVTLLRRVVEGVACDKLGDAAKTDKGFPKKLHQLIAQMHSTGLITKDLRENADEIRYFGNYGAHIQDDGLDNVSHEEVEDVNEVAWQLLYTIYIAPAAAQRLRDKRTKVHLEGA